MVGPARIAFGPTAAAHYRGAVRRVIVRLLIVALAYAVARALR